MSKPLDVETLLSYQIPNAQDDYDPRDAILYALGVGAGLSEEVDETSFLFERDLQALPTMALVLGSSGFWPMDPNSGLDYLSILHGEQRLKMHRPLEPAGSLIGKTKITDIADKGPGKPALLSVTKEVRTLSGVLVAETTDIWFLRGAGGFGGERKLPGDQLPAIPDRDPDFEVLLPTSRAQAATYRLSGDRNPLHIDPQTAKSVGFERPILHGLSTMGVIGRAVLHACCGGIAQNMTEISLRFTAPVYPGDTIRTLIWQEGENIQFRAEAVERAVGIVDNGVAKIAG